MAMLPIYWKVALTSVTYKNYWDIIAAKQLKFIRMYQLKVYKKLNRHLMIYKEKLFKFE